MDLKSLRYFLAIAEEGIRLREAGVNAPVLILGASLDTHIDCILDYGLTPTVFSAHTLGRLQRAAAERGKTCRFPSVEKGEGPASTLRALPMIYAFSSSGNSFLIS